MPDPLVTLMLSMAVAVGWFGVVRLARGVRQTSLTAAAGWAIWFQVTLTVATIAALSRSQIPPGIVDQLWYLTAVSALCPFVSVLGARRGRVVEWNLFVVLPLIIVLEWSALAQWSACWKGQRLELETPSIVAYFVVMAFGPASFLPTRFGASSLCWNLLWVWEVAQFGDWREPRSEVSRISGFLLVVFWISGFRSARKTRRDPGWNRVWQDFRDCFGIGWSFRVMARVNEVARREQWPWVLTDHGLETISPDGPSTTLPDGDPRVDRTFRWLLKPFVDPVWIDERLAEPIATSGSL